MCPHFKEGGGGENTSTLAQGDKGDRDLRLGVVVQGWYWRSTWMEPVHPQVRAPLSSLRNLEKMQSELLSWTKPYHISSAKMNAVRTALAPQAETPQATLYCCRKSWGDRMEGTWVIK